MTAAAAQATRAHISRRLLSGWVAAPVTLLLIIALWQFASWLADRPEVPAPLSVWRAFARVVTSGELPRHAWASTVRVLWGIGLSVAVALPLGLAMGVNATAYRLTAPLVYVTYPVPKIVFLPVLLALLGIGDVSKVAVLFLILVFQALIVVRDAARAVRPELVHSVRSLGAGPLSLAWFVYLPASLPALLTALRLSVGIAIAVLFFVESFGTSTGLGYFIMVRGYGRFAYADMYAGVLAMILLALALYLALDVAERVWFRWTRTE